MSDARYPNASDDERDAYLREALRHAPDANAAAPAALRDAILKQARAAAASATALPLPAASRAKPPSGSNAWSSLWAWLMRPPVAAGFASMMVATLVGVMWCGRPIDDPLLEARAPSAIPNTPPAPPATVAQAPAQPALRDSADADVAVAGAPKADTEQRRAAEKEKATSPTPTPRQSANEAKVAKRSAAPEPQAARAESKIALVPRAPVVAAPEGPVAAGASSDVAAETAAVAAPRPWPAAPAEAPTATPSARPAPNAPAAARVAAPPRPERKAEAESLDERSQFSARTQQAEAGAQQPGTQQAGALPAGIARADTTHTPRRAEIRSPASTLRAAIAADPSAWTWQRGGGPEQAMNDALQAWLAQLDDATRSRWLAGPAEPGSDGGDGRPLRLLRNGRWHSTVLIEPGAARIEAAGAAALGAAVGAAGDAARGAASSASGQQHAPLPAAAAAALKSALDQAAR